MKSSSLIYVVTMYRWGDRENHSYVLGVYSKKNKALEESKKEFEYRGSGKYFPEVLEFDLKDNTYQKTILDLEMHPDWKKENV